MCIYSISTECDPDFLDVNGFGCDWYYQIPGQSGSRWWINTGVMTDKGFMTAFNCPQGGCDENGPIRPNFASLKY